MCKSHSAFTVIIQCYKLDLPVCSNAVFIEWISLKPKAFQTGFESVQSSWTSRNWFRSFTDRHVTLMPCWSGTHSAAPVFRVAMGSLTQMLCDEFLVDCWLEETRVAVFLHEGVNFTLGEGEAGQGGLLHIFQGDGSSFMIKINLKMCRETICR